MTVKRVPLPPHLAEPSRNGEELAVTGKWVPKTAGGRFKKSQDADDMLDEWEDIHQGARAHPGVLSTEINHPVGEEAVLVHHVFRDAEALENYFSTTAAEHVSALTSVAKPELHMVRGVQVPDSIKGVFGRLGVPVVFGEHLFGFVKEDYARPDLASAIMVTAKWTCHSDDEALLDELEHWWQTVGTEAFTLEEGMVRFETYRAVNEKALVIHETFADTSELKFHLTKGTAEKYKANIDKVAAPEAYYFRGPVSWTIRTYSKFMHLPATYSSLGSHHTMPGGSMIEGLVR